MNVWIVLGIILVIFIIVLVIIFVTGSFQTCCIASRPACDGLNLASGGVSTDVTELWDSIDQVFDDVENGFDFLGNDFAGWANDIEGWGTDVNYWLDEMDDIINNFANDTYDALLATENYVVEAYNAVVSTTVTVADETADALNPENW